MNHSKKWLKGALLAVALGLTIVFLMGLWQGKTVHKPQTPLDRTVDSQAEMKLTDMEYMEMQDGRHMWTLNAAEADYFQDEQKSLLKNVRLILFLADGREILLESDWGMLYAGTKDIELWSSVKARLPEGYRLSTDRAEYDHVKQTIGSLSEIHLSGPDLKMKGKDWEYHIQEHRGTVSAGVEASLLFVHPGTPQKQ